jgi:DNA primase
MRPRMTHKKKADLIRDMVLSISKIPAEFKGNIRSECSLNMDISEQVLVSTLPINSERCCRSSKERSRIKDKSL